MHMITLKLYFSAHACKTSFDLNESIYIYLPKGVIMVVNLEESSSSQICQNASLMSILLKILAFNSLGNTSSNVGNL